MTDDDSEELPESDVLYDLNHVVNGRQCSGSVCAKDHKLICKQCGQVLAMISKEDWSKRIDELPIRLRPE